MRYPSLALAFITGPVRTEKSGDRTILAHLQKYSRFGFMLSFGFMLTWPFCFHFWLMWRLQERNINPESLDPRERIPGTEQGIYFRTPGYRWDAELGMKRTWGYLGLHWD